MVPRTDRNRYITGQPALSVPVDDVLADWHLGAAFSGRKALPIAGETMPSTEALWGADGVADRSSYLRDAGIIAEDEGPVFVASPARALADLIYKRLTRHQDLSTLSLDEVPMSNATRRSLIRMLLILQQRMPSAELHNWASKQAILKSRDPELV